MLIHVNAFHPIPEWQWGVMTNETIKQAAATPHCWSCKAEIASSDSFCPHCGAKLTANGSGAEEKPQVLPDSTSADYQTEGKSKQRVADAAKKFVNEQAAKIAATQIAKKYSIGADKIRLAIYCCAGIIGIVLIIIIFGSY
jgi:predicted amidophosphoribosyltransferase